MHLKSVGIRAILWAAVLVLAAGCATPQRGEKSSANASAARTALTSLKANRALAGLAPAALQDAEAAVRRAEMSDSSDRTEREHLGYLAEVKVELARAAAEKAQAEALQAEAARARAEAAELMAQREQEAAAARDRAAEEQARLDAERRAAESAASEAALRSEMKALRFEQNDRGHVLTLGGNALFSSGKSDIKPGARSSLDSLAKFLIKHPERKVNVEGHSDAQGKDADNLKLSQRRADAVAGYLVGHGVAAERITATGKGAALPVADNKTDQGRQLNRRVEIVLAN